MSASRLAQLQVFIAAVFFSTAGLFTGLLETNVWSIVFWRSIFAFVFTITLIGFCARGHRAWPDPAGIAAIFTSAAAMLFFIVALRLTSVANVAIIHGALPLLTTALVWLIARQPVIRSTLLSGVGAAFGAFVIFAGSVSSGSALAGMAWHS